MSDRRLWERSINRWRFAGQIYRLPSFRGQDRLARLVAGSAVPAALAGVEVPIHVERCKFIARPDVDGSFASAYFAQWRTPFLGPLLRNLLPVGGVFWDVGANIGVYTLLGARLVGPSGEVHAFEPNPGTLAWLREAVELNDARQVVVHPFAAGDSPGDLVLHLIQGSSGLASLRTMDVVDMVGMEETSVHTVRLDDAMADCRQPTVVKIDVEGFEAAVLKGMARTLSEARPVVLFENPFFVTTDLKDPLAICSMLMEADFDVWSLTPRGAQPLPPENWSHNVIAIHRSRPDISDGIRRMRFARNQNL